jgi:acyl-CoA thioester hydrolase
VTHMLEVRVYYEDTDFSGYVYHANYLKFCERGRSDFLRVAGVDQNEMAGTTYFVVRRMVCDFLKPARFDDLLTVETIPKAMSGARFELSHAITRGTVTIFKADVIVALIDGKGRPQRISATLAEKLQVAAKTVS